MFKKLVTVGLVIVMLASVVALVGCGGGADVSDHALAGTTWAWDGSPDFLYVFNANGTGTRGIIGMAETFAWSIPGNGRLTLDVDGGINEQWDYSISGDVLTIDSRQLPGMSYSYILVD